MYDKAITIDKVQVKKKLSSMHVVCEMIKESCSFFLGGGADFENRRGSFVARGEKMIC